MDHGRSHIFSRRPDFRLPQKRSHGWLPIGSTLPRFRSYPCFSWAATTAATPRSPRWYETTRSIATREATRKADSSRVRTADRAEGRIRVHLGHQRTNRNVRTRPNEQSQRAPRRSILSLAATAQAKRLVPAIARAEAAGEVRQLVTRLASHSEVELFIPSLASALETDTSLHLAGRSSLLSPGSLPQTGASMTAAPIDATQWHPQRTQPKKLDTCAQTWSCRLSKHAGHVSGR